MGLPNLDVRPPTRCEPLCALVVDTEFTVRVVALKDVAPGVPLSIDYEALEEDMVTQGVDFTCSCGASTCRGRIVGSLQRTRDAP
jgi:SET domain-containing protein